MKPDLTYDRREIGEQVSGCRSCDCPPEYGPPTTIYNRFVRWAERGVTLLALQAKADLRFRYKQPPLPFGLGFRQKTYRHI